MALIKWLSGVSGNWTNAGDWAGGMVPGAADDVTIDASGVYGVTISSADAAHSLTLNDPTATLSILNGGTLTLGTTLTANFGTVDLYGGVIAGGTLAATGGKFLWDGTVSGVTVDGTIDLSAINARLSVTGGGLTDKGAHGTGAGTILLTGGDSELWRRDQRNARQCDARYRQRRLPAGGLDRLGRRHSDARAEPRRRPDGGQGAHRLVRQRAGTTRS